MKIINIEYIILIMAGVICILAFAPFNQSLVIIVSLMLLISIINNKPRTIRKFHIFKYGYFYGLPYFITQLYWVFPSLYEVIQAGFFVSIIAWVLFSAFLALYIALTVVIYTKIKLKSDLINLLFLFPSIWVLLEWLRGWLLTGFSWCDLSYTQVNNEFLRGFFPLLGNYGVSWIVLSIAGALYLIFKRFSIQDYKTSTINILVSLVYVILALFIGFKLKDIQYTKPIHKPISVALIQGNIAEGAKWRSEDALPIYANKIAQTSADLIFIPETAIEAAEFLPSGYLNLIENYAKANKANLIIGTIKYISKDFFNYVNAVEVLTDPKKPYYAKYHLVPYGEYIPSFIKPILSKLYQKIDLPMVGFSSGAKNQEPIAVANQKLAFNICYENGFSSELIATARKSSIMVNLSDMVWYGTSIAKDEHLQLSQARALENQRYFIQVTNTGITAIIRPNGTIQSILPVFQQLVLKDNVQGMHGSTPYEIYGNYLIITLCMIIVGIIVLIYYINKLFKKIVD